VDYRADLAEAFARLFEQEGFQRRPTYLQWAFSTGSRNGLVALARDRSANNKIVGLLGLLPSQVVCARDSLKAYLAVDLVVDPGYRGRGLFMGLGQIALEGAERLGAKLVWGFPNEAAAHGWFNRFGWVNVGPVPLMVRPLRSGFFLRRISPWLGKFDIQTFVPKARRGVQICEIDTFGSNIDKLWHAFSRQVGCCQERDAVWLNWRINRHPLNTYRTVAIFDSDGCISAFVTSRLSKKGDDSILYIMEAMCDVEGNDKVLVELLNHELFIAAEQGAGAALSWCRANAPNYPHYRRSGFLPVPARVRPRSSFMGVRLLGDQPQDVDFQNWYISYLDLDTV